MRLAKISVPTAFWMTVLACGGSDVNPRAEEAISKDAFVEAYVELRTVGLRAPQMEISLAARDSVLSSLGLTQEDLLTFVDVWGRDGEYMEGVWAAVDSLLREERVGPSPGQFDSEDDPDPESPGSRRGGG